MPDKRNSDKKADAFSKSFYGLALAGAAKAALTDLPKASIERAAQDAVELRMDNKPIAPAFKPSNLISAVTRRGLPRLAGGIGAGALTFPVFMSGIKDIKEGETKQRRARGFAKVIGSGLVYSGGKGSIEYALESMQAKKRPSGKEIGAIMRKAFTARAIPGVAAAGLTAATLGYGLRKQQKEGKKSKSLLPLVALAGGVTSAAKQLPETVYFMKTGPATKWSSYQAVLKQPKVWVPRVVSRGLGGALGAVILGGITQKLLAESGKKKAGK